MNNIASANRRIRNIYELTPLQEGILFHSLYQPSGNYIVQTWYTLEGKLNIRLLKQSLDLLFERHEALRTAIIFEKVKQPVQVVMEHRTADFRFEDFSGESPLVREERINACLMADRDKGFHLTKDVLLRLTVCYEGNDVYRFLWTFHHILMDGWCVETLSGELEHIYTRLGNDQMINLPAPAPYSNYIKWLRQQKAASGMDFWRTYLGGFEKATGLPRYRVNESKGMRHNEILHELQGPLFEQLKHAARQYQVTLNVFMQAIWGILLGKLNNTTDAVFGIIASGRPEDLPGVDRMVGLFINTIPIRVTAAASDSFIAVLVKVKQHTRELLLRQHDSLAEIMAVTGMDSDLIDHVFIFENYPLAKELETTGTVSAEKFLIRDVHFHDYTHYDFSIVIMPDTESLTLKFEFNELVYDAGYISVVAGCFAALLQQVLADPHITLDRLRLQARENSPILSGDTGSLPAADNLPALFSAQACRTPNRIAVVSENVPYTYQWLNDTSDRLAYYLQYEQQITPGQRIALLAGRSVWSIVGMLGILKAGGVYVPIDSSYPAVRQEWIMQDAGIELILTDALSAVWNGPHTVLPLHEGAACITAPHLPGPAPVLDEMIAYIIYTSGSTGCPKGVIVSHKSLSYVIAGLKERMVKDAAWHYLLLSPFSFDASLKAVFVPLTIGATLHLFRETRDIRSLEKYIFDNQIQAMHATPSVWDELLYVAAPGSLQSLCCISSGGEAMTPALARKLLQLFEGRRIYNTYGPTETTINATVHELTPSSLEYYAPPIGKPLPGYKVYILDEYGALLPPGTSGEICIGGVGLSAGYVNSKSANMDRYAADPLLEGERVYRTNDRGMLLPNGEIAFLGRMDDQVKIRGYRIDPCEIDQYVERYWGIKRAFTTGVVRDGADTCLATYYTAEGPVDRSGLRGFLSHSLPAFMIPALFIEVPSLPLDANGKVNKRALPAPGMGAGFSREAFVPPGTRTEQQLADIWQRLLDLQQVGVADNFFEIGGHSLKATRLMTAIQNELRVEIKLKDIFEYPTIRQQAAHIAGMGNGRPAPAIVPAPVQEFYELSHAQKRIWVLCQFKEDNAAYNMPYATVIRGELKAHLVSSTIALLAERHESLRTVFPAHNGLPCQQVLDHIPLPFFYDDLLHMQEDEREEAAARMFEQDAERPFDLENGPLFLFRLVRLEKDMHLLILVIHHIISDGWSQGILCNEFISIYNALCAHNTPLLPPLPVQYKDYAHWHNELISTGYFSDHETYWLQKLKDKPNGITLPTDFIRQSVQTFNGKRITFSLGESVTARLEEISRAQHATLYMTLMGIINIFLYKYTGQQDIIIGLPIAGRKRAELHGVIGFMVNTILYRLQLMPDDRFNVFLQKVKAELLEIYEHQDYPFDMLVEKLDMERNLSQSPLFNVMVAYNNTDLAVGDEELSGTVSEDYERADDFNMSKFDLIFFIQHGKTDVTISLEYNSDLFEEQTACRMERNFQCLCEAICDRPDQPVVQMSVVCPEEEQQLVHWFNDTYRDYPPDTVVQLFEKAAVAYGDRTAIRFGDNSITYRLLNEKANQLANFLIAEHRVGPHDIIGLALERSINMIITILGIIKTGAAYVAIDPGYPAERIRYMIQDSGVGILFADNAETVTRQGYQGTLILSDRTETLLERYPGSDPAVRIDPQSPLYIIYTSGSTGTPNGAVLSHGLLANLISWQLKDSGIEPGLSCLQFTSINFCVSFQEIFSTLCSGGLLHLIGEMERQDIEYLVKFLSRYKVEVLYLPFSYLNFLFNEANRALESHTFELRHIITAGEQLKITPGLRKFFAAHPQIKLHNHYGSSEMHVVSCYTMDAASIDERPVPPAGMPVANTAIYILDDARSIVPIGVWGEVCISGSFEVKGYVNNEVLTAARLYDHPLYSRGSHRLYCSGDIGRRLADGNIEIKGRKDGQVKIRGFRVEPGEVEAVIFSYAHAKDAVVVVKEDARGQNVLLAYVVLQGGSIQELKEHVEARLPGYMVPRFMLLDTLPLMPNGKVDRAALPEPNSEELSTPFLEARNEKERVLVQLWKDILGVAVVGVMDNFFELGGHSLKATRLISDIYRIFGQKLELISVFKNPTIASLAGLLHEQPAAQQQEIRRAPEQQVYPVTPAQRQVWMMERLYDPGTVYNMPIAVRVKGSLDFDSMAAAIAAVMERQEALRTAITRVNGMPVQRVLEMGVLTCPVDFYDLHQSPEPGRQQQLMKEIFSRKFDLEAAPLFCCRLIKVQDNECLLLINIHHIIGDAHSCMVFLKELTACYFSITGRNIAPLPALPVQYRDYAYELSLRAANDSSTGRNYWLQQLKEQLPVLELPLDFQRTAKRTFSGARTFRIYDTALWSPLKQLARQQHASLFSLLVALVKALLHKYTGQQDLIIGGVISARSARELEPLIGLFVNTLPLRAKVSPENTFAGLLSVVNHTVLEAIDHAWYPVDMIMNELNIQAQSGRMPLYDVVVSFEENDAVSPHEDPEGLQMEQVPLDGATSKFDLAFHFEQSAEGLLLTVSYNKTLFAPSRIERMTLHLENIMREVTADSSRLLAEITLLTPSERQQILHEFNAPLQTYPSKTLTMVWDGVVQDYADHPVLVCGHTTYHYRELDTQAARMAGWLREKWKVKTGDIVAVIAEKSFSYLAGILGIVKAGATYLPVDPDYPEARIRTVLQRAGAVLLLYDEAASYTIGELPGMRQGRLEEGVSYSGDNRPPNREPDAIAYVIYTSGSSGYPKGVPVTDEALLRLCEWSWSAFRMGSHTNAILYAGIGFDAGVWELWPVILTGGRLYVPDDRIRTNMNALQRFLADKKITHCFLPTPVFEQLSRMDDMKRLRNTLFLTGGDKLKYYHPGLRAYNNYGPAEAAVVATSYDLEGHEIGNGPIPVGKPLPHHRIYILGPGNQLLPVGVTGEIAIGGPFIAKGYIGEPELTRAHFVPDPFFPGHQMYLSGDLGRWCEDGNIEFQGRKDDQVKIRGKRITLGEIENTLLRHPAIHMCVVRACQLNNEDTALVAYVVTRETEQTAVYRDFLKQWLPAYMIPLHFVYLNELPLTPNGKIDMSALPSPVMFASTAEEGEAPSGGLELKLLEIWKEIFNRPRISVNDDFFEIGGHSLTAINMAAAISRQLGVQIDIGSIFSNPTIAQLAVVLSESAGTQESANVDPPTSGTFPLSHAQRRLWAADKLNVERTAFLVPLAFVLDGPVETDKLEQALGKVIQQHESLRTIFIESIDEPLQQVIPFNAGNRIMEQVDIRHYPDSEQHVYVQTAIGSESTTPFNLSAAPPFRIRLITLSDNKHVLLITFHHIIFDAWSCEILLHDLAAYYLQPEGHLPLQEKRYQYRDFVNWEQQRDDTGLAEYWVARFKGYHTDLKLRVDQRQPAIRKFQGKKLHRIIKGNLQQQINIVGNGQQITGFFFFFACLNTLLYRYTRQKDIVIGVPFTGRDKAEFEKVIGFFVNVLPLRTNFSGCEHFSDLLRLVRSDMIDTFRHQHFPLDKLLEQINWPRENAAFSPYRVGFTWHSDFRELPSGKLPFDITSYDVELMDAKADLWFHVGADESQTAITLEYDTTLFEEGTARVMVDCFEEVIMQALQQPDLHLDQFKLSVSPHLQSRRSISNFDL